MDNKIEKGGGSDGEGKQDIKMGMGERKQFNNLIETIRSTEAQTHVNLMTLASILSKAMHQC